MGEDWFQQTEALCLLCFFVNEATFGNNKYWFRELMSFCPPSLGQLPNSPARTHELHEFSSFYGGPILLKFKSCIQFMIEGLSHDLDCFVTRKSLIFIFSLSLFPLFLPSFLPFSPPLLGKEKINTKKAAVIWRRLRPLGALSSGS